MTQTLQKTGHSEAVTAHGTLSPGEGRASFGFYDMFCGIGAFHLATTEYGGTCVGACDNDRFVKTTYSKWFGIEPDDDVRSIEVLPKGTDWLFAGFPCPTFSLAGKSKLLSLGRKHGLEEWKRSREDNSEELVAEVGQLPDQRVHA